MKFQTHGLAHPYGALGKTNVTTRGKLGIEYAEPQKEQVRPRNAVEQFAKMIMKTNQGYHRSNHR
jgi:hypothetical protein